MPVSHDDPPSSSESTSTSCLTSLPATVSDCEEFVAVSDGECSGVPRLAYVSAMTSVPHGSPRAGRQQTNNTSPSKQITVVDVHDLAASIGCDFERLVKLHGEDCIRTIIPKVISALETLEALAANNDYENEEIAELHATIDKLKQDKATKQVDRAKFEQDLEEIEDGYRKEIAELRQNVQSLMQENRTLSMSVPVSTLDSPSAQHAHDIESILELKEQQHESKEEIRQLRNELEIFSQQTEKLEGNVEQLIRQNKELLRKNTSLQQQGRKIVEEKFEIIRRMETAEEMNISLRRVLNEKDRELEEANLSDSEPRFTLQELREVLQEKNILKGRVMELEEELDQVKHGKTDNSVPSASNVDDDDEDRPVQGPLPREPAEKIDPWKFQRRESGVRRFFQFFKELGGASPRRGSSVTSSPRPVRSTTLSSLAAGSNT